jgi:serine/threonine protein kinase
MATLNHPNIVSVIDYGEAGPDYLYIVMELVDGADLMEVIRSGGMTQEMAILLLPQICDALQFAHDHGIIHRDIKPGNIMLTRDGRVKIADFGLAKRHDVESSFLTKSGAGMGTPAYAAPEQLVAEEAIDHRADIYALGVMIYQMITGQLPRGAWKAPSEQVACDPHWDEIVNQAMQSDPVDRYQQAREVKTDISRIGLGDERSAVTPVRSLEPSGVAGKPGRSFRAPFLLVTFIALAIGGFFVVRHFVASPPEQVPASADIQTFQGHRYQFVPGAFTWDEAKTKAEEMGGHLATVTSKEENEWIHATFGTEADPDLRSSSVWLGGASDAAGQPWQWVTGEDFAFSDWFEGEPNYSSTTGQPVEGPFGIALKHRERLFWFDDPVKRGNANAGFLVEWEEDGRANPAPTLSAVSPPGTVDLLALVDVAQDAEGGIWRHEGTDLIVTESPTRQGGRGNRLSLALPVRVTGSYRIEVEFTKHGRKETIGVLLPLADDRSVVANFQESADFAGLVTVRGQTLKDSDNPSRVFHALENERRYRAAIEVLLNGDEVEIAATFEGEPLFRYQGPVADLDSRQFAMKDQARPGLKSMDPMTWHAARIEVLDGGTLTPVREGVILPKATE